MMRFLAVIFTILVGAGLPAMADAATDGADAQTKRVISDQVMWAMLKPVMKKNKAECKIALSDDDTNKNPRWTCLNNMACSYKVKVTCSQKKNPAKALLEIQVAGFDDGSQAQVQDVQITYLN